MRRLPRLPTPTPAGFVPTSATASPLRAPAAVLSKATTYTPTTTQNKQTRRYLSTTPVRLQTTQNGTELAAEEIEGFSEEYQLPTYRPRIKTQLVYPRGIHVVRPAEEVSDPTYTPAESAENLEEVGGLADWWDEPAHWGSEGGGAAQYVQTAVRPFGPADKVTDPAVLEVLGKRAIVEALVVARFAGAEKRKAVDRLFAHADGADRLGKIVRAEVVAKEDGTATLKESADWVRVWDVLKSAVKKARQQQQQPGQNKLEEGTAEVVDAEALEAAVPGGEAKEAAPAPQLTPQVAKSLMGTWNKEWKKAELRDPIVKFYAAKRIQQLTGHRIPDGKLLAIHTIDGLLKQLVEPPKPKKLAEFVEKTAAFKDLRNVRVFPRRVTPIDKEQMVGRWKIIVKELEKRELPVTGTGDYGPAIEKRWLEGKVIAALLRDQNGGVSERTERLSELVAGLRDGIDEDLAAVVEKLADGARDPSWRLPIGVSGLLELILSSVPGNEPRHLLLKQMLRLVGNACADCNENRALVVSSGVLRTSIMGIIEDPNDDDLLPFATAAVLNLCLDYDAEPKSANPDTPTLLLGLATSERYDADLETFMEICTPTLAYLTFQNLQSALVRNTGGVELLQLAFHQLYTRFDNTDADADTTAQLKQTLVDWLKSCPPLSHLQTAACLSLGNLSRSDESSIALLPRVRESLIEIVSRAILPASSPQSVPKNPAPPLQLTHAALSFLKNLAIPQANKPIIGTALLDIENPILPRLWASTRTQPQLQFTAVSLTRLLLVNCPPNIRRICAPTTSGSDTEDSSKSNLALLTATAASADEDPIKVEAARAASLVCRALHSVSGVSDVLDPSWDWSRSTSSLTTITTSAEGGIGKTTVTQADDDATLRARFYAAHSLATIVPALRLLLTHPRFPALHSETIFVLALMSRGSPEGARAALQVLLQQHNNASQNNGAGWQVIAKAITGFESQALADVLQGPSSSSRVEEVRDAKDGDEKQEKNNKEVTVERLSLEPQMIDAQGHKQQQPARVAKMDRENAMGLFALRKPLEELLNKGKE
ncbi:hypothetical protein C7999DRAFT_40714 [Corynascus novoguineensis]|uniref:Large ribosomal subunit protein mL50 n=1 Tax=Corynascus novoguineensis TaxID=1126955 RepID=A0AAN7CTL4_9PEZI|nr:hypothetical protein C7999DRAFT_40714 [Corynascus novoguineensis]